MNPWILIGAGVAWALSIAATGAFAYGAGQDNVTAFNAKSVEIVQATREAAQTGAAQAIADKQPVNKTIVQKVQHEIQTNTVYAECKHTDAGLRGVNEALTGRPQPVGDSKLP